MLKIIAPKDCDNAPKRRLIKDLNIAFANADIPALLPYFHEDIVWEMVNDRTISGIDNVAEFLKLRNNKNLLITYNQVHILKTHAGDKIKQVQIQRDIKRSSLRAIS